MKIWSPLPDALQCSSSLLVIFLVASAIYMLTASEDPIIQRIAIGCLMWAVWIFMASIDKGEWKISSRIKFLLNL